MENKKKLAYNLEEAAMALGVSRPTMMRIARRSDFPALRAGRRWLIPVDSFNEWLCKQAGEHGVVA